VAERDTAHDFDDDAEFMIEDSTALSASATLGGITRTLNLSGAGSGSADAAKSLLATAAGPLGAQERSAGGEDPSSDDFDRRPPRERRGFVSGGESSAAEPGLAPPGVGIPAAPAVTHVEAKKFHKTASGARQYSAFDDSEDEDDAEDAAVEAENPRSGTGTTRGVEVSSIRSRRSSGSNKRSASSRKTADVSLSLNSSKRTTGTGHMASSRHGPEEVEEIEDDDQLAAMLGFIGGASTKR
jgi:hypothetical protein